MSQPESMPDPFGESTTDRLISEVLRALPFPDPSSELERRVRCRLRQRRRRRFALAGSIALVVLLAGLMFWQPRMGATGLGRPTVSRPVIPRSTAADGSIETRASATLNASELDALFALPPVEPLGVLERRQTMAFNVLEHLE